MCNLSIKLYCIYVCYMNIMLYHFIYSVRYYPRLHVTTVGLGMYYPCIWRSTCILYFMVYKGCSINKWTVRNCSVWKISELYAPHSVTARWYGMCPMVDETGIPVSWRMINITLHITQQHTLSAYLSDILIGLCKTYW